MDAGETMVRMGELTASARPGHVLVALGLGSCIGLALLDRHEGAVGLAHVVLPKAPDRVLENPLKFADRAAPALADRVVALGARRSRLEAVLVGGASMFAGAAALEVGSRNEAAVRAELTRLRIPVVAVATGGSHGRTMRVEAATAAVRVRESAGADRELVAATRSVGTAA